MSSAVSMGGGSRPAPAIHLHVTAGRGPDECAWVAARVVERVVAELAGAWLGTVQWIGHSPVRPGHRRINWFVAITPLDGLAAPAAVSPDVDLDDVRVETYRASGPGGQRRNKVETAVRMIHLPTGLTVDAGEARSQAANRRLALERLRQRLGQRQLEATLLAGRAR